MKFLAAARRNKVRVLGIGSVMAERTRAQDDTASWERVNKLNRYAAHWISENRISVGECYLIVAGGSHTGKSRIVNRNARTMAEESARVGSAELRASRATSRVPGLAAAFGIPAVMMLKGTVQGYAVVSHDQLLSMPDHLLSYMGKIQRDGQLGMSDLYLLAPE